MKKICLLSIIFYLLISFKISSLVYATSNDSPQPYEESYPQIGYKSVEEAVKDFECHFNQKLILPVRLPFYSPIWTLR
jgi:hypothetical protein